MWHKMVQFVSERKHDHDAKHDAKMNQKIY